MGNHFEEGEELSNHIEDKKDKNENKELTDGNGIENEHKENDIDGGSLNENSNIGESMKRTSKYSTTTSSSDNLRIFVLLGIITSLGKFFYFLNNFFFEVLLVTIALGSIFSARYVKRSRQLHGKYQPAAYEMQTQQRENRYQTSINYSSTQTSLYRQPSSPLPSANNNNFVQQPQINATFGKEERLI
ncbi:hypothetical protein Mgra_00007038 [Meloidogyne graminicola]|uniref:Transmembrane protein n=1 Tax=Meloidogyne graminicola TaxID=189291 RepID=A0A8S9ZJK2_9BILA|nr:hypothetical protein Mgra_00007038 [Meloidogyne graminicola]